MSAETNPEKPTEQDTLELFRSMAAVRSEAQARRLAYHESLTDLWELSKGLKNVELKITGRLHGRGNTTVYRDDPKSLVEGLHIRVISATVNTYEGHGEFIARHLPFIDIYGKIIEADETISAWLGVGDFGVNAEVIESHSVEV